MISSSTWTPRGFALEFPQHQELSEEDISKLNELADLEISSSKKKISNLQSQEDIDDDLKEFDFEHYDDDEEEGQDVFIPGLLSAAKLVQESEEQDPYIVLPNPENPDSDDEDERRALQIYPTDNLVLLGRTEDEISYLDVYVYDDGAGAPPGADDDEKEQDPDARNGMVRESNLYVHHDMMLPAFPLCIEWLSFAPNGPNSDENVANYAAVGTFDPIIELWNLDVVDSAYPTAVLGGGAKKSGHVTTHHTDAVLGLAHNRVHRAVLALALADATLKLWDLAACSAVRSVRAHSKKTVSSLQWHHNSALVLLSGGYDAKVCISDVRIADDSKMSKKWSVDKGEDVENVCWADRDHDNIFYAGTDAGVVYGFDARMENEVLWKIQAHDLGISLLQANQFVGGMIATSAVNDKSVKLWRVPTAKALESDFKPSMVLSRDFGVGNVLLTSFAGDIEVAGHLVAGGVTGPLKVWDAFSNKTVRKSFREELKRVQQSARAEADSKGKASRIARKYAEGTEEQFMEGQGDRDEEEDDEEEEAAEQDESMSGEDDE